MGIEDLNGEKLERLYWHEMLSTREIAERHGVNDETVRLRMVRFGVKRRSVGGKRTFNIGREQLEAEYQTLSMKQIARKHDVGETVVWKRLKEYGIKLKDYEDGGHRKKPGRRFSAEHRKALSAAHKARDQVGARNKNWRGGVAVSNWKARNTPEYRRWRAEAIERAEHKCQGCGVRQGTQCECCGHKIRLHVHHVKSFASHPELRYDPANSEVVCPKCHTHRHNGKSGELLETPNA